MISLLGAVSCGNHDASTCGECAETPDYRTVNYEDLLPSLEQFFDEGVKHFDELLFDLPHHQLIVG